MNINLQPIGFVTKGREEPIDDNWDTEISVIELNFQRLGPDALLGLDQFSHAEILYWFHHPAAEAIHAAARHPRGNPDWPAVGILAQRAKNRPNRLGLTTCRVVKIEGPTLTVAGLDAIAGTPVLDIKPYMSGFAPRGEIREPQWAQEMMAGYW